MMKSCSTSHSVTTTWRFQMRARRFSPLPSDETVEARIERLDQGKAHEACDARIEVARVARGGATQLAIDRDERARRHVRQRARDGNGAFSRLFSK
jgi:hypothetical protein